MINQHFYPLRIHIEDTDYSGFVFHGHYIYFFERARSEWGIEVGIDMEWQRQNNIGLLVHSLQIQYIKPARLHQQVEVVSEVVKIGSASIVYAQRLRLLHEPDSILCKIHIKVVCVNEQIKPVTLPHHPKIEALRRRLSEY